MFTPASDSREDAVTPYRRLGGEHLDLPPLRGEEQADIVIVGGGITGCSAALHAAEAGARVTVLEAMTIGWGASSRNSGHLPPATKHEPAEILRRYGREHGQRIIDASASGPQTLVELTQRHGIECGIAIPGILSVAHTPVALRHLEERAAYWESRGEPIEVLDRDTLAAMVGSRFYLGGVLDKRGGSINPLAYVRGLAKAAIAAGARLYEKTPANSLEREGHRWKVSTPEGVIRADRVFLCTNAHTDTLLPGLKQTVLPVRVVQLFTRPLSDNLRRSILPGREPLLDTRRVANAIRMHEDGGLHFSYGPMMRVGSAPSQAAALARVRELFPQLGEVEIAGWWAGWMGFNPDNSWQMHSPAPGLHAALGCNGRGVVLATLYGRDLARHAAGVAADDLTLPITPLKRVPFHAFSGIAVAAVRSWYRVHDAHQVRRTHALREAS
ncbi:MAG: Glycine/D-amino acid oxidase [Rubritepida sp.]|nr:Glycine/D-amino acid oxidase [Rubritepida sp.]